MAKRASTSIKEFKEGVNALVEEVLRQRRNQYPFLFWFNTRGYNQSGPSLRYFGDKSGLTVAKVIPFLTGQSVCDIFCHHASAEQKAQLRLDEVPHLTEARDRVLVDVNSYKGKPVDEVYTARLAEMTRLQSLLDQSIKGCFDLARANEGVSPELGRFCKAVVKRFEEAAGLNQVNVNSPHLLIRHVLSENVQAGLERARELRVHRGGLVVKARNIAGPARTTLAREAAADAFSGTQTNKEPGHSMQPGGKGWHKLRDPGDGQS